MVDEPRVARVTMVDCSDCATLERKIGAASLRESGLLREVESLRETLASRRHWIRIVCDRCGARLEIASTLEMPEPRRLAAMRAASATLGWRLSIATLLEIDAQGDCLASPHAIKDLCQVCGDAMTNERTAR